MAMRGCLLIGQGLRGGERDGCYIDVLTIEDTQKKSGNIFICDVIGVFFSLSVWPERFIHGSGPDPITDFYVSRSGYDVAKKFATPTASGSATLSCGGR